MGRFFSVLVATKVDGASFEALFAKLMEAGCAPALGCPIAEMCICLLFEARNRCMMMGCEA